MKVVAKVKLDVSAEKGQTLRQTVEACNHAANEVSKIAREQNIRDKRKLREATYDLAKPLVDASQAAQAVIRKVADAHKTHRANLKAGNYGKRGTHRRAQAEQKVITFRADAAQPYDARNLTWDTEDQSVRIWVVDSGNGTPGRIRIPYTGWDRHLGQIAAAEKIGESDLVRHGDSWYLLATIEMPGPEITMPATTTPADWIGVDLGLVNIAYDSDETSHSGAALNHHRLTAIHNRRWAQARGTRTTDRLLGKWRGREGRYATDVNHRIAKEIVDKASRTGRGIALEDLTGIRARARQRKPQRTRFHSWAFGQLADFIVYKAHLAGVPVVFVDPAYTSQRCHQCGHIDKKNRTSQAMFTCVSCGFAGHADHNAAINIAHRAPAVWAEMTGGAVSHAADAETRSHRNRGHQPQQREDHRLMGTPEPESTIKLGPSGPSS